MYDLVTIEVIRKYLYKLFSLKYDMLVVFLELKYDLCSNKNKYCRSTVVSV